MRSEFSRRLRKLRSRKNVSLQVLADFCGVNKSTVIRYERGERIPNLETAALLAEFFGVTIDYLYGRK